MRDSELKKKLMYDNVSENKKCAALFAVTSHFSLGVYMYV